MFTEDQRENVLALLNQALPENADALVSARAKLTVGQTNFSSAEQTALDVILRDVQYKGTADHVMALMNQINLIRALLIEPTKPATQSAPVPRKKAGPA